MPVDPGDSFDFDDSFDFAASRVLRRVATSGILDYSLGFRVFKDFRSLGIVLSSSNTSLRFLLASRSTAYVRCNEDFAGAPGHTFCEDIEDSEAMFANGVE